MPPSRAGEQCARRHGPKGCGQNKTRISTSRKSVGGCHSAEMWRPAIRSTTHSSFLSHVLELKAVTFAVQAFTKNKRDCHVHLRVDNTTVVAQINKMGHTRSRDLLLVAKELWQYCIKGSITMIVEHLPGVQNTVADQQSRMHGDVSNWQLNPKCFRQMNNQWNPLEVDLFAVRLNSQTPIYVSWKPDPAVW